MPYVVLIVLVILALVFAAGSCNGGCGIGGGDGDGDGVQVQQVSAPARPAPPVRPEPPAPVPEPEVAAAEVIDPRFEDQVEVRLSGGDYIVGGETVTLADLETLARDREARGQSLKCRLVLEGDGEYQAETQLLKFFGENGWTYETVLDFDM